MEPLSAETVVSEYALLQGRLVRLYLDIYKPTDVEGFRDVPNGRFEADSVSWTHTRHGAGILFLSDDGVRVNAHVAMVAHPEGLDGGRLFEYLHSKGIVAVRFKGLVHMVGKAEMDRLVRKMAGLGLLRRCETRGPFPDRVFEVAHLGSARDTRN